MSYEKDGQDGQREELYCVVARVPDGHVGLRVFAHNAPAHLFETKTPREVFNHSLPIFLLRQRERHAYEDYHGCQDCRDLLEDSVREVRPGDRVRWLVVDLDDEVVLALTPDLEEGREMIDELRGAGSPVLFRVIL
jgi:hypothetical protein